MSQGSHTEAVAPHPSLRLCPSSIMPSRMPTCSCNSLSLLVTLHSPARKLFPLLSLTPTLGARRSGAGGFSLLANNAPSQLLSLKTHPASPGAPGL